MKVYIISTLIFPLFLSCLNSATEKKDNLSKVVPNTKCCQPDSVSFYYKNLSITPDVDNYSIFTKMVNLNDIQIRAWLQPILKDIKFPLYIENGGAIKKVSFQKKTNRYMAIIIALVFDEIQQYYVTINSKNQVIDWLEVSYLKNLSNSDVEYNKEKKLYKFSTKIVSCFAGDTINVYSIEEVSKIEEPHANKDTWQELFETKYIVKQDGTIQLLGPKKQLINSKIKTLMH